MNPSLVPGHVTAALSRAVSAVAGAAPEVLSQAAVVADSALAVTERQIGSLRSKLGVSAGAPTTQVSIVVPEPSTPVNAAPRARPSRAAMKQSAASRKAADPS